MNIRREKTSQRRHHRLTAPIKLTVNGAIYPAVDWSLGGFRIGNVDAASVSIGDDVKVEVELPFQGFEIAFETSARIIRVSLEHSEMACAFNELDQRQTDLLKHFISEIVSGSITAVDDTLQRIDSPVTPASMEPDPNPMHQVPPGRWSTRQLGISVFYVTIGLALASYFGLTVYSNFFSMKLESGVVSAPLEQVVSPTDGKIRSVAVQLQKWVPAASELIIVEDAELEEDISFAEIQVERADVALRQVKKSLDIEEKKSADYLVFAENQLRRRQSEAKTARVDLKLAHSHLDRVRSLVDQKLASRRDLDEAEGLYGQAKGRAESSELALELAEQTVRTLQDSGRYFSGERFEGEGEAKRNEIESLQSELILARKELRALIAKRERISIAAPTNGRLVELAKSAGSAIKKGEVLGYFEREEARVVDVFLTQSEILNIAIGQSARVYLPAIDQSVGASVAAVDRSTAFLDGKSVSYNWRSAEERTARVTLLFNDLEDALIREKFPPGTPAVVLFPGQANSVVGEMILAIRSHFKTFDIDGAFASNEI